MCEGACVCVCVGVCVRVCVWLCVCLCVDSGRTVSRFQAAANLSERQRALAPHKFSR